VITSRGQLDSTLAEWERAPMAADERIARHRAASRKKLLAVRRSLPPKAVSLRDAICDH
jgi:hypothetical protein